MPTSEDTRGLSPCDMNRGWEDEGALRYFNDTCMFLSIFVVF